VEAVLERALLRKGASADDIAEQVVTFCRTDTTTGQVVPIDSGFVFN
jgi:3-oxoacyl-[acyl-carrier protein] reductase